MKHFRLGESEELIKEVIDYTRWQKDLYNDMSVETLGKMSYEYCKNN